jgi:hypothetical protein
MENTVITAKECEITYQFREKCTTIKGVIQEQNANLNYIRIRTRKNMDYFIPLSYVVSIKE